jgi:YfiH family protein
MPVTVGLAGYAHHVERRTVDGLSFLVAEGMEREGFLVAFSERAGGVSGAPFDSLNLGYATGDRGEHVRENRDRLVRALGIPPFAIGKQAHGSHLVRVGEKAAGAGFQGPPSPLGEADVLAVSRPQLPVAVLVADCVPLALASPDQGLIAAVHAGWRGLAAGVVPNTLSAFEQPGRVLAAIGPSIGPCHYEVGDDVAAAVGRGSEAGVRTERRDGRLFLDLSGTVARILRALGVRTIDRSDVCTACEPQRFFSHRRDGETGRQSLVALRL